MHGCQEEAAARRQPPVRAACRAQRQV